MLGSTGPHRCNIGQAFSALLQLLWTQGQDDRDDRQGRIYLPYSLIDQYCDPIRSAEQYWEHWPSPL